MSLVVAFDEIKPDQIRLIIGPGGKTIKGIVDQTGVAIDVEDDGTVNVASSDPEAVKKALDIIKAAHEKFRASGHGDAALLYNGKRVKHYGLTNQMEFFAEMTEAFFGVNDFFPFNRAELQEAEPELFQLLTEIWVSPEKRTPSEP